MFGFGANAENILRLLCSGEESNVRLAEELAKALKIPLNKLIVAAGYPLFGVRKPADFLNTVGINWEKEQLSSADFRAICRFLPLKSLLFRRSRLETLEGLEELPNLAKLEIYDCELNSWGKRILPALRELSMDKIQTARVADFERWLGLAVNLNRLSVNNSGLENADFCAQMVGLEELRLSYNPLKAAPNLQNLGNLRLLSLQKTQLKRVDLSPNSLITYLFLANNELDSIDLSQLQQLFNLDLTNNRLQTLDISSHRKLSSLGLAYNNLQKFELGYKPYLQSINLLSNRLKKLHLSHLPQLETVNICYNPDLAEVELEHLPNLQSIKISKDMIYGAFYQKLQQQYKSQLLVM